MKKAKKILLMMKQASETKKKFSIHERVNQKSIALINFGGIGDEILFLPVVESLKKEFEEDCAAKAGADAKITLVLEPRSASIVELTPLIDEVIKCDIKAGGLKKYFNIFGMLREVWRGRFDLLITSGSSPFVAVLAFLTGIKKRYGYKSKTSFLLTKAVPLNKNQYASNMYHDLLSPLFKDDCTLPSIKAPKKFEKPFKGANSNFIAIHPGVSKMSVQKNMFKCPDEFFWRGLIGELLERGEKVVLLGGPDDKEIIEQITRNLQPTANFTNLYGKTKSLLDMADVINYSKTFICVDSAPMHIGVALNKNLIAIFGPTDENKLIPKRDNFKVVKAECSCRPCLWEKRQTTCETLDCLKIDPKAVVEIALSGK